MVNDRQKQSNKRECNQATDTDACTHLAPQQERAVYLLVIGKTITDVSQELEIDRSTIYNWQKLPTFQAHFNSLRAEIQSAVRNSLFSLHEDAIETIRRCLRSDRESVAIKAATLVLEHVKTSTIGKTDALAIVRDECTSTFAFDDLTQFDRDRFENLCEEYGLAKEN